MGCRQLQCVQLRLEIPRAPPPDFEIKDRCPSTLRRLGQVISIHITRPEDRSLSVRSRVPSVKPLSGPLHLRSLRTHSVHGAASVTLSCGRTAASCFFLRAFCARNSTERRQRATWMPLSSSICKFSKSVSSPTRLPPVRASELGPPCSAPVGCSHTRVSSIHGENL